MPVYAASRRLEYQNDNQNTDQTGDPVKFDVKAVGFDLDSDMATVYDSNDEKLDSANVNDTPTGIRVSALTGNKYTVVLPASAKDATVSCTGGVTATKDTGSRNLIVEVTGKDGVVTLTIPEAGKGTVTDLAGKTIGSVEVGTFGDVKATFTIDVPTWAYMGQSTNVEVKYDIYVDGEPFEQVATAIDDNGGVAGTDFIPNASKTQLTMTGMSVNTTKLNTAAAKGHTVSLKLSSVDWKAAKVEVRDNAGKLLTTEANTSSFLTTANTTGAKLEFNIDTVSTDAATWTITGAKGVSSSTALSGSCTTNVTTQQTITGPFYAEGGKVVTITVTPENPIKEKFNVTIDGAATFTSTALKSLTGITVEGLSSTSPDNDAKLAVTSTASTVDAGENATYTVAINNHTDKLVDNFEISYTLNGVAETKTVNGVSNWQFSIIRANIQSNQDLVITGIKANAVKFLVDENDTQVNKRSMVIGFTEALTGIVRTEDNDLTNSTYSLILYKLGSGAEAEAPFAKVSVDNKYLTIIFDADLAVGDYVIVDAAVVSADTGKFNKKAKIEVTEIKADGTYVFTVDSSI